MQLCWKKRKLNAFAVVPVCADITGIANNHLSQTKRVRKWVVETAPLNQFASYHQGTVVPMIWAAKLGLILFSKLFSVLNMTGGFWCTKWGNLLIRQIKFCDESLLLLEQLEDVLLLVSFVFYKPLPFQSVSAHIFGKVKFFQRLQQIGRPKYFFAVVSKLNILKPCSIQETHM